MKTILLIGLGRFGRHIVMKLNELKHQVMAVDQNEERVNAILPFVTNAQIGDSTSAEFLADLGVRNFDVCIVAIGDNFQSSLETASLLKELGAKKVVARAARDVQAKFLLCNGADEVVYPEKQMAFWTAIRYSSDHIFDYISLGDDYAIFEVEVPGQLGRENHSAAGRSETVSCEYHGHQAGRKIFHDSHCAGYLPARPQHRPSHGHSAGSSKMLPYIKK